MDVAEVNIAVESGRNLCVHRYGGAVLASTSNLDAAFNMSRSGMRGFLSKNGIKTVQNAELKAALGLGGKAAFLDRNGIESLLRLHPAHLRAMHLHLPPCFGSPPQ